MTTGMQFRSHKPPADRHDRGDLADVYGLRSRHGDGNGGDRSACDDPDWNDNRRSNDKRDGNDDGRSNDGHSTCAWTTFNDASITDGTSTESGSAGAPSEQPSTTVTASASSVGQVPAATAGSPAVAVAQAPAATSSIQRMSRLGLL
ncbi:hypothetical protein PC110_g17885 [Phytophthora cactorum]|uniref:Uncharacterized protein n=1 Tax=Phytophthora cactorum TaxID=29920 RepID=A0A329RMZ4_9STRA|nr:hypothetical protein PC110_g17885 [Phytophthora cactorum]